MAIIRLVLGQLILFFNWVFTPRSISRPAEQQANVDAQTNSLTLYQYKACPFCVKVRRAMKRQALTKESRSSGSEVRTSASISSEQARSSAPS